MSLADTLLPIVHSVRAITGQMGVQTVERIDIVHTAWDGEYTGEGVPAEVLYRIVEADQQPPSVKLLDAETLALTSYAPGSVRVGPITPPHEVDGEQRGTSADRFRRKGLDTGDTACVRITRRSGVVERYVVAKIDESHSTGFVVTLQPIDGMRPGVP